MDEEWNQTAQENLPVSQPAPDTSGDVFDRKSARRIFSRLGWGAFAILAVTTAVQIAVSAGIHFASGGAELPSWVKWVANFAPLYCFAVPIGFLIMRKAPAERMEPRPLGVGRFLKLFPICVFLMYAGNLVGVMITGLLGQLKGDVVENPLNSLALDDSSVFIKILVMAILAPLVEEFIFRKVLIDRMRPYGEKLAVVTSALMFGLFHGNLSQFFYAFALGMVFGYVYLKTGRLRYSAALHMIVNLFGSVVAPWLLKNAGIDQLSELDVTDALGSAQAFQSLLTPGLLFFALYSFLIFLLALLGLVLLCISLTRLEYEPAARELPRGERFSTVWCNAGMIMLLLGCIAMIAASIFI